MGACLGAEGTALQLFWVWRHWSFQMQTETQALFIHQAFRMTLGSHRWFSWVSSLPTVHRSWDVLAFIIILATDRYGNKKCQGMESIRVKIRVEGTEPDWAAAPCCTVREALSTEMMCMLKLNYRQKQHWRDLGCDFPGEARADTKTLSSRYWRNRRKRSAVEM